MGNRGCFGGAGIVTIWLHAPTGNLTFWSRFPKSLNTWTALMFHECGTGVCEEKGETAE